MIRNLIKKKLWLLLLAIVACASSQAAELRFAMIFTDQGVLQREMAVPVWGWADPSAEGTPTFQGQKYKAKVGENLRPLILPVKLL